MNKNLLTILLIIFIPVVGYMALTKSLANTNKTEEISGRPQVIKFTSSMCLDCQKMNKIFQEIFPKYENRIGLTEIHVQDGKSFTGDQIEKYNVTLVPTIILLDSHGRQVRRIEGAIERDEMDNYLKGLD